MKKWSRRKVLGTAALGVAGAGVGSVIYTFAIGPEHLVVRELTVRLPRLPKTWQGARLVHLSDLHVGARVDPDYLGKALEKVRELKPDLIVVTGDWVDGKSAKESAQLGKVLTHLEIPDRGCFGILGNHDYGRNWSDDEAADRVVNEATQAGVQLLRNHHLAIDGLDLIGFDDLWARGFEPEPLFRELDPANAHLALAHNPDTVDLTGWGPFDGLVLSGHTHGGQCKPPFLPPPLLPVKNRRYTQGLFGLEDGRQLHINPGLGTIAPVRFNVRPEISVLTLEPI